MYCSFLVANCSSSNKKIAPTIYIYLTICVCVCARFFNALMTLEVCFCAGPRIVHASALTKLKIHCGKFVLQYVLERKPAWSSSDFCCLVHCQLAPKQVGKRVVELGPCGQAPFRKFRSIWHSKIDEFCRFKGQDQQTQVATDRTHWSQLVGPWSVCSPSFTPKTR